MASKGIINGPVYEAARFSTQYLNVPPGKHRLYNAFGLMIGLYMGRKVMDILAGETPDGKPVDKDDLIPPLKPLHGIFAYDHFSDDPKMRWMRVADQIIPGMLGGLGAMGGSFMFFREPYVKMTKTVSKLTPEKFMLGHAEQSMLFHQFKVLSRLAGISAVPGSASGFGIFPSTLNYSTTLGSAFSTGAERNMSAGLPGVRGFFNTYSSMPMRWHRLILRMESYLKNNPSPNPEKLEEYLNGLIKPLFNGVTAKQMEEAKALILETRKFTAEAAKSLSTFRASSLTEVETRLNTLIADAPDEFIKKRMGVLKGKLLTECEKIIAEFKDPAVQQKKIKEQIASTFSLENIVFSDMGFEKLLIKLDLDPRQAAVGDMGTLSTLANWCGKILRPSTAKEMEHTHDMLVQGLEMRHPELKNKAFDPNAYKHAQTKTRKAIAGSLLGVSAAGVGAVMLSKDAEMADLEGDFSKDSAGIQNDGKPRHHVHTKRNHGLVNGKILDTAEGITGMIQSGIGSHRVHCAAGLTAGMWLGDKIMDALTGVKFDGRILAKDDIWEPLQKLHGILKFNPNSDLPKDKWMQVLRWGVPGVIGAVAVVQGSRMFFEKRHATVKKAVYLDEVEDKGTFAQSNPWSYASAVASLFGSASGLQMLPFGNYATSLGTRYSLGSGRKVSLPVVGKYWSNNSTLFPYGPPGMIELLIKESVNNKSFDPELLETYAIGILKPWFKKVTPAQIESFVMEVHRVRDKFFQEGGVPEEMKAQLEQELKAHFKGAGLEDTLEHIGLDPMKATIAENGWSGAIANALGGKGTVDRIKHDYRESYAERHRKRLKDEKEAPQQPTPGRS